jgi:hypothetical protein
MTELVARTGAWMLQQSAALPDTVVMVAAERGWFETVTSIASGILSITLVVLTIFVAPAAWQFWKTFQKAQAFFDKMEGTAGPLARNASALATRLGELNALLSVAQEEAEGAFVATAAAVRGVRQGAATLGSGLDEADDELEEGEDDGDEQYDDGNEHDGSQHRGTKHDGKAFPDQRQRLEDGAARRPARPRLSTRRRRG